MGNAIKRMIKRICGCFFLLFPIRRNTVFLSSFGGQYNDNAKYVSVMLHKKRPDIKLVWSLSAKSREDPPNYVETVEHNSLKYCMYACTAQVTVDNSSGYRNDLLENKFSLIGLLSKFYCRSRKQQLCISIWHGTPIKKIGCDEPDSKFVSGRTSSDLMITGNQYAKKCLLSAFPYRVPIMLYGTPRNDIIFNKKVDVISIKNRLQLPQDKRIILFAPTFRDDLESSGVMQMSAIDFGQLFSVLNQKFTGDWCFVFRVHQRVLLNIDVSSLTQKYGKQIINGNIGDDMAEYLVCADILLTDYSSSMFDFALTKRPCFLFTPDREHYENSERGFYMDFDNMPFPKACSFEDLIRHIDDFDMEAYRKELSQFLMEIGNAEDGHATERVVDDILRFLSTGKKGIGYMKGELS